MNNKNSNNLLNALLPVAAAIVYVLLGYFFKSKGWAVGWLIFLLIPVITSGVTAHKTKNPSAFVYPVLVTTLFLAIGLIFHVWHPTWLLFITIPAYYSICDYIKQKRIQKVMENAEGNPDMPSPPPMPQAGEVPEYAQYPQNPPYSYGYAQPQKSNTLTIILSVILSFTIIAVAGIFGAFSFLKSTVSDIPDWFEDNFTDDDYTSAESEEVSTAGITDIEIDWVNGNVTVEYYDGDKIYFEEDRKNDTDSMCYKIEDGALKINEYQDNKIIKNNASKDLTVKIPLDFVAAEIEIDVVSAKVSASGLKTAYFELNTVSGNAEITFAQSPKEIETDSVSGNVKIILPEDVSGYSIKKDSVSGSFTAPDFDNSLIYGDGSVIIDSSSVSGSLTVSKAQPINE